MDFTPRYITHQFTAYLGEVVSTDLSLAVWLADVFSKEKALGRIKVLVKEGGIEAKRNLSGYYFFTDLAGGIYTVIVESDLYFIEEKVVNTAVLDPKNPETEILLKPKPPYAFPSYATLVRGQVASSSVSVVGASIKVMGKDIKTKTDDRGEFVIFFKGIKTESITIEIKKNGIVKIVPATIKEGETTSLGIISFP